GRRLVAYVVPAEAALSVARLRAELADRLPPYLVPAVFLTVPALPLTEHGKLDRAALPKPDSVRPDTPAPFRAPQSPAARRVARIFADVLGIDRVGEDDDFFALGGHSLLAMRLVARVNDAFGADLP